MPEPSESKMSEIQRQKERISLGSDVVMLLICGLLIYFFVIPSYPQDGETVKGWVALVSLIIVCSSVGIVYETGKDVYAAWRLRHPKK